MWVQWNLRCFWTWQDIRSNSKLFSAIWSILRDRCPGTALLVTWVLTCPAVVHSDSRMLRKIPVLKTPCVSSAFQDSFSLSSGYRRKTGKLSEGCVLNSQEDLLPAFSSSWYLMTKGLLFKKKTNLPKYPKNKQKICKNFTGILGVRNREFGNRQRNHLWYNFTRTQCALIRWQRACDIHTAFLTLLILYANWDPSCIL